MGPPSGPQPGATEARDPWSIALALPWRLLDVGVVERYAARLRKDPEAMLHVLLWAFAADALNHAWTPLAVALLPPGPAALAGVDAGGLLLNAAGAVLAGAAAALLEEPAGRPAGGAGDQDAPCGASVPGSSDGGPISSPSKLGGKAPAKARWAVLRTAVRLGGLRGLGRVRRPSPATPAAVRVAVAFKGGFIACFTSFCGLAEQLAAAQGTVPLLVTFACGAIGGPALYLGSLWACRRLGLSERVHRAGGATEQEIRHVCLKVQLALAAFVGLTLVAEAGALGGGSPESAAALAVGLCLVGLAVLTGDLAAMLLEEELGSAADSAEVNWATVSGNALGLFVRVLAAPSLGGQLLGVGDKFRGSFCGTLSAYGDFSEDVASPLSGPRGWRRARANFGCNVLLAGLSAGVLRLVSDAVAT